MFPHAPIAALEPRECEYARDIPRRISGSRRLIGAKRVIEALRAFGAPLQDLTEADLTRAGTVFQIGVAPIRIDVIRDRADREVSLGAIYKTLGRLHDKGFVTSRTGAPTAQRGGRRTRCYAVTAAGRRALEQTLRGLRRLSTGLDVGFDHA